MVSRLRLFKFRFVLLLKKRKMSRVGLLLRRKNRFVPRKNVFRLSLLKFVFAFSENRRLPGLIQSRSDRRQNRRRLLRFSSGCRNPRCGAFWLFQRKMLRFWFRLVKRRRGRGKKWGRMFLRPLRRSSRRRRPKRLDGPWDGRIRVRRMQLIMVMGRLPFCRQMFILKRRVSLLVSSRVPRVPFR